MIYQANTFWTPKKLKKFKKFYQDAKANGYDDTFSFEGNTYVVGYAKYLIEYLEGRFK